MGADSTEKAYRSEVRVLYIHTFISRYIHTYTSGHFCFYLQLKPLQATMTLLQQSIQQQEATHSQKTSQLSEQLHSLEDKLRSDRFKREINEGNVLNDMAKVEAVVDGVINSRGLGQVDQLSVDIALSKNNEYILQVLYVWSMYTYVCNVCMYCMTF
jgi:hypothetical protein